MRDQDNNDNGSVWTSYSDMFTTMAIIFLVMFVFALLRSGVSTLAALKERQEKEAFVNGQISKKEIERDKKVMKNLESEIAQMNDFNQIIDSKITQMNSFSERMKKHKQLVAKALKKQNISHVALLKAQKVIKDKNIELKKKRRGIKRLTVAVANHKKQISDLKGFNTQLVMEKARVESDLSADMARVESKLIEEKRLVESKLTAEKQKIESKLTTEKKELKKQLVTEQQSSKSLKNEVIKRSKELAELQKLIDQKLALNKKLNQKIASMEEKLQSRSNELSSTKSQIADTNKKVQELERQLASAEKNTKNLSEKLAGKNSEVLKAQEGVQKLQGAVESQKNQITQSMKRSSAVESKLKYSMKENLRLQKEVDSLVGSESDLKSKLSSLQSQLNSMQSKLGEADKRNKRVARGIASVQKNMRSKIGARIAKHLAAANLKVKVDPMTGSVTLVMDENFRFKRNSALLSNNAQSTLQQIIPVYTTALFSDPKVVKYIEGINIVGHASPRYEQEYISPASANHNEAYNYNMALSTARAKEIVKYIFSDNFGRFRYKATFRSKVSAIGRSFSEPIRRAPASEDNGCGIYDCPSSRRVEIKFTLKEDNKVWKKLQRLN